MKKGILLLVSLVISTVSVWSIGTVKVVTENLRLRKGSTLSSEVITTLKAGSYVGIQYKNNQETIDGISDYWYKVITCQNATDRDGKPIPEQTEGFVFGAYLKDLDISVSYGKLSPCDSHVITTSAVQTIDSVELFIQNETMVTVNSRDCGLINYAIKKAYVRIENQVYYIDYDFNYEINGAWKIQKTIHGYLIKYETYEPFLKSDGSNSKRYIYLSEKAGNWYLSEVGSSSESVVEFSGSSEYIVNTENQYDYTYAIDYYYNGSLYMLEQGEPVVYDIIRATKGMSLFSEPNQESDKIGQIDEDRFLIILEKGNREKYPNGLIFDGEELIGDWTLDWVKVQGLDSGITGWTCKKECWGK